MQASDQIIQVLDALCEKFGIVINWTGENVVPYLQELMEKMVNYELWTSIAWIAFIFFPTFICFFVARKITKGKDFDWDDIETDFRPGCAIALIVIGIVLLIILIIAVPVQIMDIITCFTFPEKIIFNMIQMAS